MYLVYGTIGIFLISILIIYAYFKKPQYGINLAVISIVLVGMAVFWNLSEETRSSRSLEKIPLQQLLLSDQSLAPAYGNRYLYRATLENKSSSYQLLSLQLELKLQGQRQPSLNTNNRAKKILQWSKLWLDAGTTQQIEVYFTSNLLATTIKEGQWKVKLISSKAR